VYFDVAYSKIDAPQENSPLPISEYLGMSTAYTMYVPTESWLEEAFAQMVVVSYPSSERLIWRDRSQPSHVHDHFIKPEALTQAVDEFRQWVASFRS
jgi:hypothetical protein